MNTDEKLIFTDQKPSQKKSFKSSSHLLLFGAFAGAFKSVGIRFPITVIRGKNLFHASKTNSKKSWIRHGDSADSND
jgi:hypothetical protein